MSSASIPNCFFLPRIMDLDDFIGVSNTLLACLPAFVVTTVAYALSMLDNNLSVCISTSQY